VIYSIIALQMLLLFSWYQSTERYALGTLISGLMVPSEGAALLIAVLLGATFFQAALVLLVVRSIGLAAMSSILVKKEPWIEFGWKRATFSEIRRLAQPALAALGFPLSTALNIQGAIIIVGVAISPAAAAMFGTIRTITRVPLQIVGTLSRATMPEIAIAYALNNSGRLNRLVATNLLMFLLVTLPASVILLCFGQSLLDILTRGQIRGPFILFFAMTIIMFLQTLWNTVGSFLFALNLQQRFTYLYAVLSVAMIFICFFAAKQVGIEGIAIVLLAVDGALAVVTLREWARISGETYAELMQLSVAVLKQSLKRLS
jgi:O-antigen/teichoic acid export membrane protein